ncbi:hypothetical protein [Bacillus sp. Marseille-Q3570]|uniref:hypothetical protein n=1 Tax=Bacillus sp. Marseille-Q3570 TaxID=2963522 RepID=UPI0021B716DB|nr:hypothetical protein [Bacillus sp. Marseille-Q3570]
MSKNGCELRVINELVPINTRSKCMDHLDLLGVDKKVKQLVSMYLELAYHEGERNKEKELDDLKLKV